MEISELIEEADRRQDAGAFEEAAGLLRRALEIAPDNVVAAHDLACVLAALGRPIEALAHMRRTAELEPDSLEVLNNLGALEANSGNLQAAIECYRRAATIAPANAVPLINLGEALLRSGRPDEAVGHLRIAATLDPDQAEAWAQLGAAIMALGWPEQAIGALARAGALSPGDAKAQNLYADALQAVGRLEDAMEIYERALAIDPAMPDIWYGLGHARLDAERYAAAIDCFERYLASRPDDGPARYGYGKALHELGRTDLAVAELRCAAERGPEAVSALARETMAIIAPGDPAADNRAIRRAREEWRAVAHEKQPRRAARRARGHGAPLRIGYVSAFFDRRNWMKPVWGLINRHDRKQFEIHLFSDTPVAGLDAGYARDARDRVHDISGMNNREAARTIADLGIDVLIDLNGYSRVHRLGLFAHRPAPVIVGWFNHYATTGIPAFDYLIGDAHVIPVAEERYYGERILRVPGSYLTFEVLYDVPAITPPPCLANGFLTFGSLVSQYKITDRVVECWAEILRRAAGSRLLLKNVCLGDPGNRAHLTARLAQHGVDPDRLILEGPAEHRAFLEAYGRIDIALDSFPYNGGTTTTEAIWQGAPVASFHGERWASRTSASILNAAGLSEFVAGDIAGYIDLCAGLANAPDTPVLLEELRDGARERLSRSEVCAVEPFARTMEEFYLEIAGRPI